MARRLTILVDRREASSGIVEALSELRVDVREVALPLADYMVARGVGVERKTVGDFHRSIGDGRLWRQVASLRADLGAAYVLIEGADIDHGSVSREGVRGAVLEVIRLGIPVLRSVNVGDSALWLARLASRAAAGGPPGSPRRSRAHGPATPTSILCGIPGISPRLASKLLGRFGSVGGVAQCSVADLTTIPGIGEERARAIRRLLGETSPDRS